MGTFKYAEAGLGVGVEGGGDLLSGLFVVTRREQSVSDFMSFKRGAGGIQPVGCATAEAHERTAVWFRTESRT